MYDFFSRFPRVVHLSRFHRSWVIRSLPRYLVVAAVYFFINGNLARMFLWVVLIDINIASDTFAWI